MPFPFFHFGSQQGSGQQQQQPSTMQRAAGIGLTMLNPLLGLGYRAANRYRMNNTVGGIYNGMGSGYSAADRAAINGPAINTSNLGFGYAPDMSQFYGAPQAGSQTSNAQLQAQIDQMAQSQMQARIDAARGGPAMQPGAGMVNAGNPYGAYRTRDETSAQRDARYATEDNFVNMRNGANEAINANELMAAVRGRMA